METLVSVAGAAALLFGAVFVFTHRERTETHEELFGRLARQMSETLNVRSPGNLHGQARVAIEVIRDRLADGADLRFQRKLFVEALKLNWPSVERTKLSRLLAPARLRAART